MQPQDRRPAIRIDQADTQAFDAAPGAVARARSNAVTLSAAVPPKLAKMLLPGEHVTFGTSVHPVVLLLPLFYLAAIVVAGGVLGEWIRLDPRHAAWLASGFWPKVIGGTEIALGVASLGLLLKRVARFQGLRVVSTNRRIFAIRGVIVRRITPLGNTALAGSTLSQGILGRMLGYGSIDLPLADGTPDRFRDVRDALELYREMQAVANGVEGDAWTPAVRHTIIP
jgi:Bacterial PH domain